MSENWRPLWGKEIENWTYIREKDSCGENWRPLCGKEIENWTYVRELNSSSRVRLLLIEQQIVTMMMKIKNLIVSVWRNLYRKLQQSYGDLHHFQ